jgi:hypothetical protein
MFVYVTLRRGIEFAKSEVECCDWAMAEIDRHRELFGDSSENLSDARGEARRVSRRG